MDEKPIRLIDPTYTKNSLLRQQPFGPQSSSELAARLQLCKPRTTNKKFRIMLQISGLCRTIVRMAPFILVIAPSPCRMTGTHLKVVLISLASTT